MVDNDSLFVSTVVTALTAGIAALLVLAWPRRSVRFLAFAVLVLALWNLGNCLSYYGWRSDRVFCNGGC